MTREKKLELVLHALISELNVYNKYDMLDGYLDSLNELSIDGYDSGDGCDISLEAALDELEMTNLDRTHTTITIDDGEIFPYKECDGCICLRCARKDKTSGICVYVDDEEIREINCKDISTHGSCVMTEEWMCKFFSED